MDKEVKKKKRVVSFKSLLKIDKKTLDQDFANYPDLAYDLGVKMETIRKEMVIVETQMEDIEAMLAAQTRNKYKRAKEKLTETAIKDIIRLNPELREMKKKLNSLTDTYRMAKLKKEALKSKFDCMCEISHNVRLDKKVLNDKAKGL